jgi:hypothetical protein
MGPEKRARKIFVGSLDDDFPQNYFGGVEAGMARRGAVKSAGVRIHVASRRMWL